MLPIGQGTASLFTRDLLEKLSRLLFIASLYIYTPRVNRSHLAMPRFTLAALSPVVMKKTRLDGTHTRLFILFPLGQQIVPRCQCGISNRTLGPLSIPTMVASAFAAYSSSPLPTGFLQELVKLACPLICREGQQEQDWGWLSEMVAKSPQ